MCDGAAMTLPGLYNGATGIITDMKFTRDALVYINEKQVKYKLLPTAKSDGSMARQTFHHRPLPIVYVQMDNEKIDTTLFPNRIVPIGLHQYTIIAKRGQDPVYR
jgi:hypothetical protein